MTCRTLTLVLTLLIAGSGVDAGEPVASAPAPQPQSPTVVSLDGDQWLLAIDPKNEGRQGQWFSAPVAAAQPTRVPWIIQEVFPGHHGVAWYWRDFTAPRNPHDQGRYLLRFWAVDYRADVWLNGVSVGQHEGGEDPFVLDVTDAVKPDAPNRIAVRLVGSGAGCAGINRQVVGDERALQERRSDSVLTSSLAPIAARRWAKRCCLHRHPGL